jgi:hypothetical protein
MLLFGGVMRRLLIALVVLAAQPNSTAWSQNPPARSPASHVTRIIPSLVVTQRVDQIGAEAYEPMIARHPGGALFVAGFGEPWSSDSDYAANPAYWDSQLRARLWVSRDAGGTWKEADLGLGAKGVVGNSDVDLGVAPDGTLYLASMTWDDRVHEGQRIAVGVSHDLGATWTWRKLASRRFDDRPWVVVAPNGTAHVIWNDDEGVQYVVSRDHGKSWRRPTRVYDHAGSSHFGIGPHGELAVRLIPWSASHNFLNPGADLIAVSTDAGSHWKTSPAPGERQWGSWAADAAHALRNHGVEEFSGKDKAIDRCCSGQDVPRWIEPLAWDGEGRLYSLWTDTTGVWLARSTDRGATWHSWRIVESSARCFYPYLVARGDGELAATWHSGKGDTLRWQAAIIRMGHGTAAPRVVQSPVLELETFNWGDSTHPSGVRREPAGEYLPVTFLRNGGIAVVTPVQDPRAHRVGFTYWRFELR